MFPSHDPLLLLIRATAKQNGTFVKDRLTCAGGREMDLNVDLRTHFMVIEARVCLCSSAVNGDLGSFTY